MKNKVSMLSAIAVAILLAASLTILLPAEGGGGGIRSGHSVLPRIPYM